MSGHDDQHEVSQGKGDAQFPIFLTAANGAWSRYGRQRFAGDHGGD